MKNRKTKSPANEPARDRIRIGDHVTLIRRGKQAKWTADYWYSDPNGNRQHSRKSLKTRNLRAAEERAREIEVKLSKDEGRPEPELRTPIEPTIAEYISSKRVDGLARKSLVKYSAELNQVATFLKEEYGVTLIQAITLPHIDGYKLKRKDNDGLKSYTLHNHIIIVKSFLKWCKKRKKIVENPLADLELREPSRQRHPAATQEQVEGIIAKAEGYFLILFTILAFTGLRIGEAAALRPEDVDLKTAMIHVRRRDEWRPKTESSEREVPIHPRLLMILHAWAKQGAGVFWFVPAPPCHRYPAGGHYANPRTVNERFEEIAESCNYIIGRKNRGLTLHSLRRFFKTFTMDAGVPKPMVDFWMGHRKKSDMDQYYYDPQKSAHWMDRVPFGEASEQELKESVGRESAMSPATRTGRMYRMIRKLSMSNKQGGSLRTSIDCPVDPDE